MLESGVQSILRDPIDLYYNQRSIKKNTWWEGRGQANGKAMLLSNAYDGFGCADRFLEVNSDKNNVHCTAFIVVTYSCSTSLCPDMARLSSSPGCSQ